MILLHIDPTSSYLKALSSALAKGDATEHTHRPALKPYLESLAPGLTATNEPRRIACGAPDHIVTKGEAPLGYIEAKDIGESLDKVEKPDQMARYKGSLGTYAYAVFHAPSHRSRYAEFLKIDFPRLPLTSNLAVLQGHAVPHLGHSAPARVPCQRLHPG